MKALLLALSLSVYASAMADVVSTQGFELNLLCNVSRLDKTETYFIELDSTHSEAKVSKQEVDGRRFLTSLSLTNGYDEDAHTALLFHGSKPFKLLELAVWVPKKMDQYFGVPKQKAYLVTTDNRVFDGSCYVQFLPFPPSL